MTEQNGKSLLRIEAYKLCAAIRALEASRHIDTETGAEARLLRCLTHLVDRLGVRLSDIWRRYDAFTQHCEDSRVLARIESGDIDHATVKFPVSVRPTNAMRLALEMLLNRYVELIESGDAGNWGPHEEPAVIRAKEALKEIVARDNRVSIHLPDAQAMLDMFKSHNAAELSDGAVGMGDDLELAERVEAAIATARGTTTGRVSSYGKPNWTTSNTPKRTIAKLNTLAFARGESDRNEGKRREDCPYNGPELRDEWFAGFDYVGTKESVPCSAHAGFREICNNCNAGISPCEYVAKKPATVATVTIHKGAVEQVLFNLAHGLPDGVYGLVKP